MIEKKQNTVETRTTPEEFDKIISKDRLLALCDGVFAIVMTILIIDIRVPHSALTGAGPHTIQTLTMLLPNIEMFAVTFITVGSFWMLHHLHFRYIIHSDRKLIWINIVYLLFISFVPFTSDLVGDNMGDNLALTIYGANLAIIWLIIFLNWMHAIRTNLLDPGMDQMLIDRTTRKTAARMAFYLAAGIISLLNVHLGLFLYMIAPFVTKMAGKKTLPAVK